MDDGCKYGVFGVNEIALRLPSIILTTAGIGLSYFIGKYFFNRKTGYLTVFFYSINGLIIELTAGRVATDHIDIFFLFFIELGIVFSIFICTTTKIIFQRLCWH
ncbi:MAG TPA: glycosyltransferase family 39 protein [Flavipsychrobacter sp.]|nr:glycosyltransferase family 39 protein [Flavipsychrobacter sp.]